MRRINILYRLLLIRAVNIVVVVRRPFVVVVVVLLGTADVIYIIWLSLTYSNRAIIIISITFVDAAPLSRAITA